MTFLFVSNHVENTKGASTNFTVASTGEGIQSGESASESEAEVACADSFSCEMDELNRFEEGDLDGKNDNRFDNDDNI